MRTRLFYLTAVTMWMTSCTILQGTAIPTSSRVYPTLEIIPSAAPTRPTPTPTPTLTPTPNLYPTGLPFSIGRSVEDRHLWVWQFGDGRHALMLIGAIHGRYEANTTHLIEKFIAHFTENPDQVVPDVTLYLMPTANPDGSAAGDDEAGRFNANGIDLNRNWGCNWSTRAYFGNDRVDPGARPFSEPETRALRGFISATMPDAVIFYHSAAGAIFPGRCGGGDQAAWLGPLLADATGYDYGSDGTGGGFTGYPVTGTAANWAAEQGIPAAVIELTDHDDPEFERNLKGVMALQRAVTQTTP